MCGMCGGVGVRGTPGSWLTGCYVLSASYALPCLCIWRLRLRAAILHHTHRLEGNDSRRGMLREAGKDCSLSSPTPPVRRRSASAPSPATWTDATRGPAFSAGFSPPAPIRPRSMAAATGRAPNSLQRRSKMHEAAVVAFDRASKLVPVKQWPLRGVGGQPCTVNRGLA